MAPDERYLRLTQARAPETAVAIYRELSVDVHVPDRFATPNVVLHLFDNVHEFVSAVDPVNLNVVARGRSWLDEPRFAPLHQIWTLPLDERSYNRGFRCARSYYPIGLSSVKLNPEQ